MCSWSESIGNYQTLSTSISRLISNLPSHFRSMAKSLNVAYGLWFLFGWLGGHHLYLRRYRHALFTFATLGGVFGIGWFIDCFNLPRYVADINETPEFIETIGDQIKDGRLPKIGTCHWATDDLLGCVFGILFYAVFWSDGLNLRDLNILTFLAHILLAYGRLFQCLRSMGNYRQTYPGHWPPLLCWVAV